MGNKEESFIKQEHQVGAKKIATMQDLYASPKKPNQHPIVVQKQRVVQANSKWTSQSFVNNDQSKH